MISSCILKNVHSMCFQMRYILEGGVKIGKCSRDFQGGGIRMLMVAHVGVGGVLEVGGVLQVGVH